MEAPYTGILPYQAIREMLNNGEIKPAEILSEIEPDQVQPALSVDLDFSKMSSAWKGR